MIPVSQSQSGLGPRSAKPQSPDVSLLLLSANLSMNKSLGGRGGDSVGTAHRLGILTERNGQRQEQDRGDAKAWAPKVI